MHLLRFHYRKLLLFIAAATAVVMLLMSQVQSSSSDTNEHLLKSSWQPSLSNEIPHQVKYDVPHLSHHSSSDRLAAIRLNQVFLNLSEVTMLLFSSSPICPSSLTLLPYLKLLHKYIS